MMPLRLPFKFKEVWRRFGDRPFALLDVGAGNHSASLTKRWFPNCHYAGIDRDRSYNNDGADFAAMDEFFELDLTDLRFEAIPGARYDVILMAHVIEHLPNGDEVIRGLVPKLRPGGVICIEFPGRRSLHLPSKKGTLNFHDDPTHVRLLTAGEVAGLLRGLGLEVLRAGTRRDPLGILLLPVHALRAKQAHGYVPGGVFWDLLGFADYVVGRRPESSR
ncbi:MAG: class I SAM-dependent methyltransferase [Candidatus Eisenbacteria bacterium]|nr:class I SAM-dependent methyltransferase [Candidatus Eisenbacteria bacterium]